MLTLECSRFGLLTNHVLGDWISCNVCSELCVYTSSSSVDTSEKNNTISLYLRYLFLVKINLSNEV